MTEKSIWSTRHFVRKNDRYIDSSTQWTLVSLIFDKNNYCIKTIYDQKDTPNADMCLSINSKTHSVYSRDKKSLFQVFVKPIPYYRKIALLLLLIKKDEFSSEEKGFLNKIFLPLYRLSRKKLDQNEEYID